MKSARASASPNALRGAGRWAWATQRALMFTDPHIIMMDAVDAQEVVRIILGEAFARFGEPYAVIHRADVVVVLEKPCSRTR